MKKITYLFSLFVASFFAGMGSSKAQSHLRITTNPASVTVCTGISTSFSVAVSDSPGLHKIRYNWQVSPTGTSWTSIRTDTLAATTDNYAFTPTSYNQQFHYRAVITDTFGNVDTTSVAVLTVDTMNAGAISGPSAVCAGSNILLTEDSTGGTWSSSNSAVAIVSGGTVIGIGAGSAVISYSTSNVCGAGVATYLITVNPVPAISPVSGPDSLCRSSTITLTDTSTGGTWSGTASSVATVGSGGSVTGLNEGFDTVKYTIANAFCSAVAYMVVRVDTSASPLPISGPTSTCVHNTITLTNPNRNGTWAWTASNSHAYPAATGDITGLSYGVDTITYNFANACGVAGSSSYTVVIDTPLNPGTISGASSLCAGSWTNLTESVPGGSWFSSNSSIAVVTSSGTVTGVDQGSVTISYYLTNSCGATIATHTMTLYRTASMISGNDSVGIGSTRNLTDSVAGGVWTSSNTFVATVGSSTGIVTGVSAGTVNITYTVTNFCGTSYAVLTMQVASSPSPGTIYGLDTVCIGHTITLADTLTPGGVWSSSNDTFATVNSTTGTVTGVTLDPGMAYANVTINYTYTNGFGSSTTSYNIVVLHTPIVSISEEPLSYNLGQTYYIKGTPAGGTWTHTNPSIGTFTLIFDTSVGGINYGTFVSYVMTNNGTDVLHYSVTNDCGTTDSSITATILPSHVGVANVNNSGFELSVYPNPNQGQFSVSLSGGLDEQASVVVTDLLGKVVEEFSMPTNKLVSIMLNQPAGVYLLSATTSGGKYTTRISVTK